MISQLTEIADTAVVDEVSPVCDQLASTPDAVVAAATPIEGSLRPAPSVAQAARLADVSATGVRDLVKVFKLLSDETRLRILLYLTQRPELHVRALCDKLRQSQPAVSHHLALLRVAGLIECRREGKHNFYHLLPERFEQLLDTVFEAVPSDERQIRFEDYVLKYAPQITGD
ncbi:MAG: metalloregulator ArsR/SmtB family transcription factor [Pirellulales bacterium]|nr:metalloregulator ArsR/SmtB family transcription factor [Pirellulales bacterium]